MNCVEKLGMEKSQWVDYINDRVKALRMGVGLGKSVVDMKSGDCCQWEYFR